MKRNAARRKRSKVEGKKVRVTVSTKPERFTRTLDSARYIITSAQNATPVHEEFFEVLKVAAEHLGAELVVIPLRYKNPTSIWSNKQETDEWWGISPLEEMRGGENQLKPHLFNTRKKLNENLVLVGDVKIQPTAISPLSGFEALTGAESCILGHPKMQFVSVPAPTGRFPKILCTTGACTRRNYTDTRAGKLGSFHHFLGAVIVEVQNSKVFHLRQINADRVDGSFTDLDLHFTKDGVEVAPPAAGLVLGDTHARFTSAKVDSATFGKRGIVETLNPQTVVFHDLFDGYSVNHHHAGDPFIAQAKSNAGLGNVREEVEHAVEFVSGRTAGRQAVVVASNHDDFLSRWIRATDWRHSGNREFYLETALAMLRSAHCTESGTEYADPFVHWVNQLKGDAKIKCLRRWESHKIAGVEVSLHGHRGPNGAKATMKNFARLGARLISGHAHTPGIEEGHYRVGTSTPLKLEYTDGPSSWLNTHCVIYATGKRSLITIVDGQWHLPRNTPTETP